MQCRGFTCIVLVCLGIGLFASVSDRLTHSVCDALGRLIGESELLCIEWHWNVSVDVKASYQVKCWVRHALHSRMVAVRFQPKQPACCLLKCTHFMTRLAEVSAASQLVTKCPVVGLEQRKAYCFISCVLIGKPTLFMHARIVANRQPAACSTCNSPDCEHYLRIAKF
ncbi:hypothetical protein DUNSADRAFT_9861 [Dunaliella salina]|uniref:Secreted protein n=1 Tax=Dunaliella salina TaxID=3046 RepID=A0ABQ7H543_DUNSA|nr:hypothetical protein DUNSADRAFT_9861 [Dunaliella salina]|eukprot:KAF5841980.1 hypothetical protein DUNSADRAFT_9861 [Dunaliella salina]